MNWVTLFGMAVFRLACLVFLAGALSAEAADFELSFAEFAGRFCTAPLATICSSHEESREERIARVTNGWSRAQLRLFLRGREEAASARVAEVKAWLKAAAPPEFAAVIERSKLLPLAATLNPPREMRADVLDACGEDFLEDNAYAQEYNGQAYIVICPGAVAASAADLRDITMTLGHELSHHFDSEVYPALYERMLSCYQAAYPRRARDLKGQLRELGADHWGLEVLARAVTAVPEAERDRFLRRNLNDLCGSDADDEHPDGDFRLAFVIGPHPALRSALGCELPPAAPACTL